MAEARAMTNSQSALAGVFLVGQTDRGVAGRARSPLRAPNCQSAQFDKLAARWGGAPYPSE